LRLKVAPDYNRIPQKKIDTTNIKDIFPSTGSSKIQSRYYEISEESAVKESNKNKSRDDEIEEMDEEDRIRYKKQLKKKGDKNYIKTRESELEEIVPKKTGNEAMREKRKEKASYTKKEDDTFGDEIKDSDMFGGNDNFQRRIAQEKEKRDQIEQKKKDQYEQKLSQYKASEEKKIEQLKGLINSKGNFTSGGSETFGY